MYSFSLNFIKNFVCIIEQTNLIFHLFPIHFSSFTLLKFIMLFDKITKAASCVHLCGLIICTDIYILSISAQI